MTLYKDLPKQELMNILFDIKDMTIPELEAKTKELSELVQNYEGNPDDVFLESANLHALGTLLRTKRHKEMYGDDYDKIQHLLPTS